MGVPLVENVIQKVDLWKDAQVEYEFLSGGITNLNSIVRAGGKKYVLRIPGEGTDLFINRQHELSSAIAAAKAGVSPEVLVTIQPENAMVIPFIEGETQHPEAIAASDDLIVKIVDLVKTVHTRAIFEPVTDVFAMSREYIHKAENVNAFFPHDFKWMMSIVDDIEKAMQRDKPTDVACHNDLLSENFILAPDGRVWLLDWEYGGMNDPFFDLGDFCVEHPFTPQQEELILTTYCGEMLPSRLYRMKLHKLMADFWWSLWAVIQDRLSGIDFDFYEYGLGRLARFRHNYYNRDFSKWLDGV